MAWLIGLGTTAVLVGIAAGVYHETQSPFGDWRNLARRAACTRSRSGRPCFAPIGTASASRRSSSRSWRATASAAHPVRLGRRRDRLLRPDDVGRPRHARVHGGGRRHVDGDAAHAPHAGSSGWPASPSARASSCWRSAGTPGSSWPRCSRPSSSSRASTGAGTSCRSRRRRGVPHHHRAHLVVARLGRATRQPRSDPDSSGQHLRDDQPGAHQRHPGRLRRGQGASDRRARGGRPLPRTAHGPVEGRRRDGAQRPGRGLDQVRAPRPDRLHHDLRDPLPRHLETAKPAVASAISCRSEAARSSSGTPSSSAPSTRGRSARPRRAS